MVLEGLQEDMDDGNIQCTNHPYKNNTAGGICAFCLQEKLGKLVSSSFPVAAFPSYSSSSSSSFRSDIGGSTCTLPVRPNAPSASTNGNAQYYSSRRTQVPIRQTQKKNDLGLAGEQGSVVFRRSKSITTPRRGGEDNSPRRTRFWSFLYLSKHSGSRKIDKAGKEICFSAVDGSSSIGSYVKDGSKKMVMDESESPDNGTFDRKVGRSRSIGCGSRRFSGLGDCTLRRVESQREGKSKVTPRHDCIKESVKCGGIFSGFMINSSSSSSSSSSYWVSSSSGEDNNLMNGKASATHHLVNGRSKSWGWALASPIRAFSKHPSIKREASISSKNTTPNLNAIPSLLSVST